MSNVNLSCSFFVVSVAAICALTGCGAPNAKTGLGGGLGAAGTGTGTGTNTPTATTPRRYAFDAPKDPNHQAVATPNSALVVYLPANEAGKPPQQLTLSPASGYSIATATSTNQDGKEVISVALSANLKDIRSISTSNMEQPLLKNCCDANRSRYNAPGSVLVTHRSFDGSDKASSFLTNAHYGELFVVDGVVRDGAIIPFHGGTATPLNQMPTTASATYNGYFKGTESRGNNTINMEYSAPMQMTADFASGTVNGTVTRPDSKIVGGDAQFGLAFNGKITGNAFEGTATMASNAPGTSTVTTGSAMNGAFYGANASQAAGAITVQGRQDFSSSTKNSPVTVWGSFGAKR